MAINLDDRYPGRAGPKSVSYPQGSFKDRTAPDAKDGTYLQQDWANDQLAFFQSLMKEAGLSANNIVDTVEASQYFDALIGTVAKKFPRLATFSEAAGFAGDIGPLIVTDMAGSLYVWTETAYFTGYRNPRSGLWYGGDSDTPEAWELLATGGVWSESNPKHARVIARYRERGRTVASGSWLKGWNHIASLGSGDWKAPDLRDVFQRMSGTDADTANPATVGVYKADTLKSHIHTTDVGTTFIAASGPEQRAAGGGMNTGATGTAETAPVHTRVAPVILI